MSLARIISTIRPSQKGEGAPPSLFPDIERRLAYVDLSQVSLARRIIFVGAESYGIAPATWGQSPNSLAIFEETLLHTAALYARIKAVLEALEAGTQPLAVQLDIPPWVTDWESRNQAQQADEAYKERMIQRGAWVVTLASPFNIVELPYTYVLDFFLRHPAWEELEKGYKAKGFTPRLIPLAKSPHLFKVDLLPASNTPPGDAPAPNAPA